MPTMPLNQLTFLSESLALRMARRNGPAVSYIPKNGIAIRPGMGPEAECSENVNSIPTRCLAGISLYCQLSPRATAPCSVDFSSHQSGGFRNHGEAHSSRDGLVFCLATPKRSRHSTGA